MRARIEAIPMPGQWWQDTLDYHVRPALEKVGESVEGWDQEESALVSPEIPPARAERIRDALSDIVLVKVSLAA